MRWQVRHNRADGILADLYVHYIGKFVQDCQELVPLWTDLLDRWTLFIGVGLEVAFRWGLLLCSLVVASLGRKRRGILLVFGSFAAGSALLLVASVPVYFAGAAVLAVFGFGNAVHLTLSQTLVLEHVEDRFRGRITSIFTMNAGLLPFSVLLVAFAFDALGSRFTIGIMA